LSLVLRRAQAREQLASGQRRPDIRALVAPLIHTSSGVLKERNQRVPEVYHQGELDVPSIKKEKYTLGVLIC
jgi:hypothetical protein